MRHRLGFICANARNRRVNGGTTGCVCCPHDPDASADAIRARIAAHSSCAVGVAVTDSFGRPWRLGQVNVAIGLAGLPALRDLAGSADADGRPLKATMPALADEIAAASGLAVAKAGRTPVVLLRGLDMTGAAQPAAALLRPAKEDLFL
ncbi:MAG: coenzyme F420-0:L-glutamate ligase [Alphaproteobacteria bacterium]